MDVTSVALLLFGYGLGIFVLYLVITAAVAEGMKRHTRWQVSNRDAIEEKYAVKRLPQDRA